MSNNKREFIVLIQARTGSTRLPNKVLLPFYKGKSILEIIIEGIKSMDLKCVVCTSLSKNDTAIVELAKKHKVSYFQGSENNVLDRFTKAAIEFKGKNIIRVCADNPFLNISYIDILIKKWNDEKGLDYLSFKTYKNIPVIKTHLGLFAEIVSLNALHKTMALTSDSLYLEHVTNYIYENDTIFNVVLLDAPKIVYKEDEIRLTIDDEDDFTNAQHIYKMYESFEKDINQTIDYIKKSKIILSVMTDNIKKYSK